MGNGLGPTHVKFKSSDGTGYAQLKPGTTWTKAKEAAEKFPPGAQAKAVRRK